MLIIGTYIVNSPLNLIVAAALVAITGFAFFSGNERKLMQCQFYPNANYKKDPEFFELTGSKVTACGLNGLSPHHEITRQRVTDSTVTYTCSLGDIDTHVSVNRYSGAAELFWDEDYLNSFKGNCSEAKGRF